LVGPLEHELHARVLATRRNRLVEVGALEQGSEPAGSTLGDELLRCVQLPFEEVAVAVAIVENRVQAALAHDLRVADASVLAGSLP